MKSLKYLAIAIMAVALISCGGKKNTEEKEENDLSTESTYVEGAIGNYGEESSNSDLGTFASDEDSSSKEDSSDDISYGTSDEISSHSSSSSSSGSEDWDALLNSYDSYVTKYISLMKKAKNGDMSALSEYPALMQKAQELSDKLSRAQGEMTASQLSRYMEITNKMARAAQELR